MTCDMLLPTPGARQRVREFPIYLCVIKPTFSSVCMIEPTFQKCPQASESSYFSLSSLLLLHLRSVKSDSLILGMQK
jgi:hypothetical protein